MRVPECLIHLAIAALVHTATRDCCSMCPMTSLLLDLRGVEDADVAMLV